MVVVFPDPLGPMSPRISPGRIASPRLSTATNPPNRLLKRRVSSSQPCSDTCLASYTCARREGIIHHEARVLSRKKRLGWRVKIILDCQRDSMCPRCGTVALRREAWDEYRIE